MLLENDLRNHKADYIREILFHQGHPGKVKLK